MAEPKGLLKLIDDVHGTSQGSVHLDALRGAAALLVFVNHTRAKYFTSFLTGSSAGISTSTGVAAPGPSNTDEADGELRVASAAVIIFFVLSGYLVGGSVVRSLRAKRWLWSDYAAKRLVRLLIVLIPAIIIGATLDRIGLKLFGAGSVYSAPEGIRIGVSYELLARLKPLVILGNLTFLQNILVPTEGTNVSLWSLANEFWYYLAFPMAAVSLFPHFSKAVRLLSLIAAAVILWFVGFQVAILFPVWTMGAFVSSYPIRLTKTHARLLSIMMTVALVAGVLGMRILRMNAVRAEYIIGLLSALLLYGLAAQDWPAKSGFYRTVSGFFSKISYTLYLFHLPLACFLCALINSPWRPRPKTWQGLTIFGLSDLAVLGVVVLMWFAFEARTNQLRDRILRASWMRVHP